MEEKNILQPHEVEEMIKAAQAIETDSLEVEHDGESNSKINTHAFNSILELTRSAIETKLTALLRTKVTVDNQPLAITNHQEVTSQASKTNMYTSFKIDPYDTPALICTDHGFLDSVINLLYGGLPNSEPNASAPLGKIGKISAEKISQIVMDCFNDSCKEYGVFKGNHYKTSENINSASNLPEQKELYSIQFSVNYNEHETKFYFTLPEEFFVKLIPIKTGSGKHQEKDFWRNAIKGEVVDSYVTVSTTINDAKIKLNDLMQLKVGDEIPIADPTLVFVCLNRLKLFRALSGQSNERVVAKIVSQI